MSPLTPLKALMPRGLFGRSLLILFVPLVLLQLVSAYVFFGTHWDYVTRRLAAGLAGDIGAIIQMMELYPGEANRAQIFTEVAAPMDLQLTLEPGGFLRRTGMLGAAPHFQDVVMGYSMKDNLMTAMAEHVGRPVFIDTVTLAPEGRIEIRVQLAEGVLDVRFLRKRLYSLTTTLFVLWMGGTSFLLLSIATLFMRIQVRAVRRLARAADEFGKGHEVSNFKPEGAAEVRRAAAAFALMRDRIKRQVTQRTEMLAGVSHDLRTPLTRMKLQLAMMSGDGIADLQQDLVEMERMVEGYLAFARGEGTEASYEIDLVDLLTDLVARLQRDGHAIDLHCEESLVLAIRPQAMSRCIGNLLGNAVRYAPHVAVRAGRRDDAVEIVVDDDGPGIPAERREDVFKAFVRLEGSRNPKTGGVGLGLTIARDVAHVHGGDIMLEDSPLGGLRARLRLPL